MFSRTFTRASSRIGQAIRSRAGASLRRGYAEEAKAHAIPIPSPARSSTGGGARLALYGLVFTSLGAFGTFQLMSRHGLGFYSDDASLARFTPGDEQARQIEEAMNAHPLVAELRARPDLIESRPHMKMPGSYRAKHLTGGVLQGPDKVPVPPLIWSDKEGKELTCIMFAGDTLCGHPGIVHGGFLATMLDEGLARCCFAQLPHRIGVTANLNIDYRKPTPAGNFLVLRADTVKVEGRKAWVEGRIESLVKPGETPTVYAEARALFISPKFASMMPKPI